MDEEIYTVEDIFERDTPLTEDLLDNSDGFTLSPITMLRRYMAEKELKKQNEDFEEAAEDMSMGYMNGGGIGSMMQPRQNYAIGGDIEQSDFGLQNIINSDLSGNQNMRTAGFFSKSPAENALENIQDLRQQQNSIKSLGEGAIELKQDELKSIQNQIQNIKNQNIDNQEFKDIGGQTARLSYDKLNNGTMSDANTSLFNQENVITPMSKPVTGITDRNRGQIPSGIMLGYTQPSADYPDMIRNPEGFPNALQNLERYQDNRFEDLDFQPGYDFKDAPNKVSNLKELYQNRNFMDNPRTGFFDNTIMSKGNPDASLVNRTKNALGRGIGSIMDFASNIPTPMNAIKGFANMRNPLSPNSQNYNPALQGQIDSLTGRGGTLTSGSTTFMSPEDIAAGNFGTKSGSMIVNSSTGKKYGPGSVLSGQNVVSGFGTNDYMGQLEKELDKMKNRAMKKDLTQFQQKKQQDILNEIQIEKDRVANELATSQAAAKAAAASFMSQNPNYGNNYNPNKAGGYTGAKDSYGDKSGTRQSNARSSELGFSDIRLKDNIELVGKSPSDINIYNFTYLNDPKVYQGVMAQEVPWASVKHDSGYLMVDYNKVDVDFKVIH